MNLLSHYFNKGVTIASFVIIAPLCVPKLELVNEIKNTNNSTKIN